MNEIDWDEFESKMERIWNIGFAGHMAVVSMMMIVTGVEIGNWIVRCTGT